MLALCLATVPATIAEMRFSKLAFRMRNWRSPESRRLIYLEYVLANDEHAKEVKLFGLGPMLLDRYKALSEEFYLEDRKLYIKRAKWTQLLSLVGTGAFYAAYAAMALLAAAGALTLGNMTMYVLAFRQGQQAFQSSARRDREHVRAQPLHVEPLGVPDSSRARARQASRRG